MSSIVKENKGLNNYVKHRRTKRILATVGGVAAVSIAAGGIAYGFTKDPAGTSVKIHGTSTIDGSIQGDKTTTYTATDNYGREITGE
jgi:hypothetical protein